MGHGQEGTDGARWAFTERPLYAGHSQGAHYSHNTHPLSSSLYGPAVFVLFSPLHCRIRLLLFEVVTDDYVVQLIFGGSG